MQILREKKSQGHVIKKDNLLNRLSPAQILVLGFAAVIFIGAFLLTLPISNQTGSFTPFVDALFTATSAVCVTGLVVVDTGTHWSVFGQVMIMFLIQIGGLGFMTVATLFAMLLGKRINLRSRILIQEALNNLSIEGVVRLVRYVVIITLAVESLAALILTIRWSFDMPLEKAFYYGVFHAVSSFNNAGFDLFGEFRSITGYVDDFTVNLVISTLIIIGGIGFVVIADLLQKRSWRSLRLHTKVVLATTAVLLVSGTLIIFGLEFTNPKTMAPLTMKGKLLAAYFQSVTPRTAGFNTLSIPDLRSATQFLMVILMFIGASPGSTGGGIKTSTFMTLATAVWSSTRGREDVEVFKRRIPMNIIYRSLTITMVALVLVITVTMILSITERAEFLTILFETTSAFGTVGLSMGITPSLTFIGRVLIILTMFAGRVGPLTVAFAVAQRQHKESIKFAQEKIMVG